MSTITCLALCCYYASWSYSSSLMSLIGLIILVVSSKSRVAGLGLLFIPNLEPSGDCFMSMPSFLMVW